MPHEQDFVYALAAAPQFEQNGLCFAARHSGLYRSTDGGATWANALTGLDVPQPFPTAAIAFSPLFAADQRMWVGGLGCILRSEDAGVTWEIVRLPVPPSLVATLTLSPNFAKDHFMMAGSLEDGVLRSADGGATWAAWNFGLLDAHVLTLAISPAFAQDRIVFAGTDSGLFFSTNGGRSWQESSFPPDNAPVLSVAMLPTFAEDGIVLVGTETQGLLRSTDGGPTWTTCEGVPAGSVNQIMVQDHAALVVHENGLFISRDRGATWARRESSNASIMAVAAPQGLVPGASLLVGLTDGRILQI